MQRLFPPPQPQKQTASCKQGLPMWFSPCNLSSSVSWKEPRSREFWQLPRFRFFTCGFSHLEMTCFWLFWALYLWCFSLLLMHPFAWTHCFWQPFHQFCSLEFLLSFSFAENGVCSYISHSRFHFWEQCMNISFSLHALNKYLNQLVLIYIIFLISLEIISSFAAKWCHEDVGRERVRNKSHGIRWSPIWSFGSIYSANTFSGTYYMCKNCTRH